MPGPMQTCDKAQAIFPDLCCVWSSMELPQEHFDFHLLLWHERRRVTARAVRLGYNVMVRLLRVGRLLDGTQ